MSCHILSWHHTRKFCNCDCGCDINIIVLLIMFAHWNLRNKTAYSIASSPCETTVIKINQIDIVASWLIVGTIIMKQECMTSNWLLVFHLKVTETFCLGPLKICTYHTYFNIWHVKLTDMNKQNTGKFILLPRIHVL